LQSNGEYSLSVFPPNTPEIQASSSNNGYQPEPDSDAEFLVKDVLIGGDCFDVENISIDGRSNSSGTFSAGLNSIGIDEGVVLGTGNVSLGVGPNVITSEGSDDGISSSDPDLQQMVNELFQGSTEPIFDATILEFEFTPTVDSVTFEYVFASEEYCDYVNSEFNDVFGFFISGPGVNGNFSNNADNIAVIPGTNDYVSINTLNINSNPAFYVDNVPIGQAQDANGCTTEPSTPSPTSDFIEYDGFSVPLQAVANVVPCETYTIKLAVADVGDGFFDSAVMLKAGSFQAGGTALLDVESDLGGNVFLQGCTEGGFTVRRANTNNFGDPFEVTLTIDPSSTAEPGVDYEPFDTVIVIPGFSMEVFVELITLPQLEFDGEEKTIVLVLDNSCSCETEETEIIIEPVPPLESDLQGDTVCLGSPVFFDPSEEVYPGVDYQWSDGQVGPAITVYPLGSGYYTVTLTNACEELTDTAYVQVVEPPKAFLEVDTAICSGDLESLDLEITFEGRGPFSFSYTINGNSYLIEDFQDSIYSIPLDHRDTGLYRINFMDGYLRCQGDIEGGGELQFRELNFQVEVDDASCGGNTDGRIEILPDSSALPYEFIWANGETTSILDSIPLGEYDITIVDGFGCSVDTNFLISESTNVNYSVDLIQRPICGENSGSVQIQIDSSDFENILWSTGDSTLSLDSLSPGVYSFLIETLTECDIEDSIRVPVPPPLQSISVASVHQIQCDRDTGEISIEVDALNPWSIQWTTMDTTQTLRTPIPGDYEVSLIDSLGCSTSLQVNLPIDTVPPSIDLPDPGFLSCIDTSLRIELDTSVFQNIQFEWTSENDSILSRSNFQITLSDIGMYNVRLRDSLNACEFQDSFEVRVPIKPSVELSSIDTLTCDRTVSQIGINHSEANLLFTLVGLPSLDTILQTTANNLIVSEPGNYQLFAIDTLSFCETDTSFRVAQNLETPILQLPETLTRTCADSILRIEGTIQGANNYEYQWRNAQGTLLKEGQVSGNSTLFYETEDSDTYFLEVKDLKTGCLANDTTIIVPDVNLPSISLTQTDTITCKTPSIEVSAAGSSTGSNFQYTWLDLQENVIEVDTNKIDLTEPGMYVFQIINTDNGCKNQEEFTIAENVELPPIAVDKGMPFTCSKEVVNWSYRGEGNLPVNLSWRDGSVEVGSDTSIAISASNVAEKYTLVVERVDNGCIDSIQIEPEWDTLSPIAIIDSVPKLPCSDEAVTLSGSSSSPMGELRFEWRNNGNRLSQNAEIDIQSEGLFELWVQNENNGCRDSTSASVIANPIVDFKAQVNPLLCTRNFGEIQVDSIIGGTPPYQFRIQNQAPQSSPLFSNLDPGRYTLQISDALGCTSQKEFLIDSLIDLQLNLTPELVLDFNERYRIDLRVNRTGDEISSVQWTPVQQLSCGQCLSPWLTAQFDQEFLVEVEDVFGCTAEAALRLSVEFNPKIFIPNVFSPNGDGINDFFFPNTGPSVVNIPEMMIFDRWGNLLFEQQNFLPNSPTEGWNGRYKGEVMNPAVFVYLIKVELLNGEVITLTGDVTLVK
jgi:gliding motility-associated-like protein